MFIKDWIKYTVQGFQNCKNSVENTKVKEHYKSKTIHKFCLYNEKDEAKLNKKFHWIHYVFKYKIVTPVFYALEKQLKKYYTKPTNKWYDKYYRIWDITFHKSLFDWRKHYQLRGVNKEEISDYKIKKQVEKSILARMYRLGFYGIVGNDSAYKEFLPIFMFNLCNIMNKKVPKKDIHHLFYTERDCYDINYYSSGYDLCNRFHIKNTKTGEFSIVATTSEDKTIKAYFTGHTNKGITGLLEQAKKYIKLIDESKYSFLEINCNSGDINNIVFSLMEK